MRNNGRILIGALSALSYEARRKACRATWAVAADDRVDVVFLVGSEHHTIATRDGDVLYLPCVDDYSHLPQKTRLFCKWAVENRDFDWLFKCDDDTYVHIDRLLAHGRNDDYVGHDMGGYGSGGAGYLLSRRAACVVAERMQAVVGAEDVLVRDALAEAGIAFASDERFHPWNALWPAPDNALITSHYCSAEHMHAIHEALLDHRPASFSPAAIKIPRIFHHVWLGGKPFPPDFQRYMQSWKAHHSDWEFRLWNEANLPPLVNQVEFDSLPTFSQKADVARYELLHRFGGVYLDTDFECFRPIDDLLPGLDGFAAEEDDGSVAVGILGAVPNHPLLAQIIDALPANVARGGNACQTTGPAFFTPHARGRPDFHIFDRRLFYPIHYYGTVWGPLSEAYALHHWAHSWA